MLLASSSTHAKSLSAKLPFLWPLAFPMLLHHAHTCSMRPRSFCLCHDERCTLFPGGSACRLPHCFAAAPVCSRSHTNPVDGRRITPPQSPKQLQPPSTPKPPHNQAPQLHTPISGGSAYGEFAGLQFSIPVRVVPWRELALNKPLGQGAYGR